jgi:hypothetical protein
MRFNMRLKILDGLERARRAVEEGVAQIDGRGAVPVWLGEVADVDAKQNVAAFTSQGVKTGRKWAALSPAYAKVKRKMRPRKGILVWDGNLRRSLAEVSDPAHIVRMQGRIISLGTRHKLARWHQDGTGRMPARPPVRKSPTQVNQLKIAIAKGLVSQMAMTCRGTSQGTILAAVASQLRADPRA